MSYFSDTGIVGGTANMSDQTFYIDSYKGSDLNVGSNAAPFQTIQKGLDEASQGTIHNLGADFILSGYFKEGDFTNLRNGTSIIAQGDVVIDGSSNTIFNLGLINGDDRNCSFNYNTYNTRARRKYGRLTIRNFSIGVVFGGDKDGMSFNLPCIYDTTFLNCARVGGENVHEGGTNGPAFISEVSGCVFKDISVFASIMNRGPNDEATSCYNNTFINCELVNFDLGQDYMSVSDCYFDQATKTSLDSPLLTTYGAFNYCHIEGTITDKIDIDGVKYDSNELAKAAYPTEFNVNGRLSTDLPEFNALTADDYTYPSSAVNATAGLGGNYIGAYGIANGAQNVDNVNWVKTNITITGVGVSSKASLTAAGTGTLETTAGIELSTQPMWLKRLVLPSLVNDYGLGVVVNTTATSLSNTPSMFTVQIKTSTDDVTYTDWIEVPYRGTPLVDGSGKGNGDVAFVAATGKRIILRYIKYKITIIDNETQL